MTRTLSRKLAAIVLAGLFFGASEADAQEAAMPGCADDVRHAATREQAAFVSDGRTVRGLIYKPLEANGAAVVLLHGAGGLGADAPRFDPHAIQLASRGYHVLVPNYYDARSGREARSAADFRVWTRAAADAVRHVGALPGMDPERVALWGYSLGGFLATDGSMAADAPARAAIGVSTGTDVWRPSRGRRALPVLMIHGRGDLVIRRSSMSDLAASMRSRGATVDIELIESSEHPMNGLVWCEVFQLTRSFLDARLRTVAG